MQKPIQNTLEKLIFESETVKRLTPGQQYRFYLSVKYAPTETQKKLFKTLVEEKFRAEQLRKKEVAAKKRIFERVTSDFVASAARLLKRPIKEKERKTEQKEQKLEQALLKQLQKL